MSSLDRVRAAFGDLSHSVTEVADGADCLSLSPSDLHEAVRLLRDDCGFETNTFITAVDRMPETPRFELTYQFLSIAHNDRVRLKVEIAEDSEVTTITDLYPGAEYSEREVFDFFGIRFAGHEGLKRLHMPEGYDHFPLRKDFPHRGIEPDKLYREWDAARRKEWDAQGDRS